MNITTNTNILKLEIPKLYYCETCRTEFSTLEENGYLVQCPYCNSHLNKELLDSYYSGVTIPK